MQKYVILCVDDEKSILDGLRDQLYRAFGELMEIEIAQSGEEALELMQEFESDDIKIPVLITDQMMPGIKGHELIIKNYERSPATFNILLTGQSDTNAITEAVNKGNLYRYISKPWDSTDLTLTIREALKSFEKDTKLEEQNQALKKYNEELEEMVKARTKELQNKNNEILDSIKYAKRIQQAILPPESLFREYIPDGFILYEPKDIVAGDFYWFQKVDNKLLMAVADCTGHGVPGAMVSVICNNGLNMAVGDQSSHKPGEVLDTVREIVIQAFGKSEEDVLDGMDIALVSFEGDKLEFSGAHSPLYIIRKDSSEVEQIKGCNQPVGKYFNTTPFKTHELKVNKGDTIYLFSDGFRDQFGGSMNKKYKAVNFRNFLLSIQHLGMKDQEKAIRDEFIQWKGNAEQVDDICIIGIRI